MSYTSRKMERGTSFLPISNEVLTGMPLFKMSLRFLSVVVARFDSLTKLAEPMPPNAPKVSDLLLVPLFFQDRAQDGKYEWQCNICRDYMTKGMRRGHCFLIHDTEVQAGKIVFKASNIYATKELLEGVARLGMDQQR